MSPGFARFRTHAEPADSLYRARLTLSYASAVALQAVVFFTCLSPVPQRVRSAEFRRKPEQKRASRLQEWPPDLKEQAATRHKTGSRKTCGTTTHFRCHGRTKSPAAVHLKILRQFQCLGVVSGSKYVKAIGVLCYLFAKIAPAWLSLPRRSLVPALAANFCRLTSGSAQRSATAACGSSRDDYRGSVPAWEFHDRKPKSRGPDHWVPVHLGQCHRTGLQSGQSHQARSC